MSKKGSVAYLWMAYPGDEERIRRSIESVVRVDPEAVLAISTMGGFDRADLYADHWMDGPFRPTPAADVVTKLGMLAQMTGAQTVVRIDPSVIVTARAKRPKRMAEGAFSGPGVLAWRYWTMRGASASKLVADDTDFGDLEEGIGGLECIRWDARPIGRANGFLSGFDFQESPDDPSLYGQARAVSFHNRLPAHLSEWDRVDAMQWMITCLRQDVWERRQWRGASIVAIDPGFEPLPVDIVVTAHGPYLRYLPAVLAGWNREDPGGRKILVLDCPCPFEVPPGWELIRGNWGHPSGARNAALDRCVSTWVHFWDADNEVPVGIRERIRSILGHTPAPWLGYFGPWVSPNGADREESYGVDTNGMWRVEAIRLALGWPMTYLEDYALGLAIQARGFGLVRWDSGTIRRTHAEQRGASVPELDRTWTARRLAIVTLQRDEARWEDWWAALHGQALPPNVDLIVCAESPDLAKRVRKAEFPQEIRSITVIEAPGAVREFGLDSEAVRHARVSGLYLHAAARIDRAVPLVLTWEDDVMPSRRDAVRMLSDAMPIGRKVGAVAGAYPGRQNGKFAVASSSADRWDGVPWSSLERTPMDVASVGAGFTLWSARAFLHAAWGPKQRPSAPEGFDWCASAVVRELGYSIRLHGGVLCAHQAEADGLKRFPRQTFDTPEPSCATCE